MRVYQLEDPDHLETRTHPWVGSKTDASLRYVDFVDNPQAVRTELEDFVPYNAFRSTQTFYRLLEVLNGPEALFRTNDCAFSGPGEHTGDHSERRLEASGRLMVLFRDLEKNLDPGAIERCAQALARRLTSLEPDHPNSIVALSVVDVHFTTLEPPQMGQQLLISFWAWGDSPFDTMFELDRTFIAVETAFRSL